VEYQPRDRKVNLFLDRLDYKPNNRNQSPHNNPAGADWQEFLVVLQVAFAASQQERYAA
jgi:hypothetical protein